MSSTISHTQRTGLKVSVQWTVDDVDQDTKQPGIHFGGNRTLLLARLELY